MSNKKRVSLADRTSKDEKAMTKAISAFITENETKDVAKNVTDDVTGIDTSSITKDVTKGVTENVTRVDTKNVTGIVTKNVTNVKVGNIRLKAEYTENEEVKRAAYHLRQSTIEKIDICSSKLGMKKAEFVDLALSSFLDDILKNLK